MVGIRRNFGTVAGGVVEDMAYPNLESYSEIVPVIKSKPAYKGFSQELSYPALSNGRRRVSYRAGNTATWAPADPWWHYSKTQWENCDGTKILLKNKLLDSSTFDIINNSITGIGTNYQWSNTDNNLVFGINTNTAVFAAKNATTSAIIFQRDLAAEGWTPAGGIFGNFEGCMSNADDALIVTGIKGGVSKFALYNPQTDLFEWEKTLSVENAGYISDWIGMSQLGNYYMMRNNSTTPLDKWHRLFARDGTFVRDLPYGSHGDFGIDYLGREVYATILPLQYTVLATGENVQLISNADLQIGNKGVAGGDASGGHLSCRNKSRPGWAYVSLSTGAFRGEMFAVELKPNPQVQRFGFNNSTEPSVACPNFDGTKIAYLSSLGDGVVESYILQVIPAP